MAIASASAWSKPGSWALDAESHESEPASVMDFPTLAAAASTKAPKKKKSQTLSLAEFNSGSTNLKPATTTRLTHDEMLALPTGPRERTAEELERPRGFGHSSYNSVGSNRNREESGPRRTGSSPRDNGPSRADEVDDWGKTKKSVVPERRGGGSGGFFDSNPSRADDANSWVSNKRETAPLQSDSRRSGSSNWGFNKERDLSSDTWGKKREEAGTGATSGTRPRLVLQPRTLPLATPPPPPLDNGSNGDTTPQSENGFVPVVKSKGPSANPFGAARPREEVLAEKGQDWRELEEKLESAKIREEKPSFSKKTGPVNGTRGRSQDRTEQAWRKPVESEEVMSTEPTEIPSSEENSDSAEVEN